jgi:hypothetical protein
MRARRLLLSWLLVALAACSEAAMEVYDAGPVVLADARQGIDAPGLPDASPPPIDAAPPDAPEPPPRYSDDRVHSPINQAVARNLEIIALRSPQLQDDVVAKVGDSITVASGLFRRYHGGKCTT